MGREPTKRFSLRTILTATTGRFVTKDKEGSNGIGDLYDLLGWMTRDTPYTHQLGRFNEECKPWLIRWFPELQPMLACGTLLDNWVVKSDTVETAIFYWLAELRLMFPDIKDYYDVPQIPQDDHERKHPYDELVEIRGADEGIIIPSDENAA